jgi:hypothetical protein
VIPVHDQFFPQDACRLYEAGLMGSWCDADDQRRLLDSQPEPLMGGRFHGDGEGKLALAFQSVVVFEKQAGRDPYDEAQTTGDCVSHAVRAAIDVSRANDEDLKTTEDYVDRTATEPLYGARGHSGQGASCARIVQWAAKTGGCMLRAKYPGLGLDLTKYKASIGIAWGRPGVPGGVTEEASKHQVKRVSKITSWQQARDALANGYGIVCCSNFGFRHSRDSEGMSSPRGSWNHAMAWTAVDATRSGDCRYLVQNSWGWRWISGPRVHGQPEGSFWISQDVAQRMINQDATYAVSNVDGWPKRKLKDWGAKDVLG